MKGLEPIRLTAPDPKSGTATNYATSANQECKGTIIIGIANVCCMFIISRLMQEAGFRGQVIINKCRDGLFYKQIKKKLRLRSFSLLNHVCIRNKLFFDKSCHSSFSGLNQIQPRVQFTDINSDGFVSGTFTL